MAESTHITTGVGQYAPGETHVVKFGRTWRPGTKRGVIFHGGRGQAALDYIGPGAASAIRLGAPWIHIDGVDGKQWGNDTVTGAGGRIDQAWSYLQTKFGAKTDKVVIYGVSMGGLTVLNWVRNNLTKVAAVALVTPAVDLRDLHDNDRTWPNLNFHSPADIETAYGGAANYTAVASAHNPAEHASAYVGIPMHIWYSNNDPYAIPSLVTSFASSAGAQVTNLGNVFHDGSQANPDEISSFMQPYL